MSAAVTSQPVNEVRDLRVRLGLSQRALGDLLHVSARTIRRWEAGDIQPHSVYVERLRGFMRDGLPSAEDLDKVAEEARIREDTSGVQAEPTEI